MQELNREANTLSSKSQDLETTRAAVDMKVLIEQMREQVQNVEERWNFGGGRREGRIGPPEVRAMRTLTGILAAAAMCGSVASAEEVRERRVVYLNGPEAMAQLERTNPKHYEIARLILASGAKLCEPGAPRVYQHHMGADEITCSNFLLRTSNRPKKPLKNYWPIIYKK